MDAEWDLFFQEFGTNDIETYNRKREEESSFNIETMYKAFKQRLLVEIADLRPTVTVEKEREGLCTKK